MIYIKVLLAILIGVQIIGITPRVEAAITIDVVGADIRATLMGVARLGNIPLIIDDSVAGKITANVTGEPAEILRLLARSKGIELEQHGDIYLALGTVGQSVTRKLNSYIVRLADPDDLAEVAELFLSYNSKVQSVERQNAGDNNTNSPKPNAGEGFTPRHSTDDRSKVVVDRATNTILFYATEAERAELLEVLASLDVKPQQVSLEAKVVAVAKDAAKELGVDWSWSSLPQYPDVSISGGTATVDKRNVGDGYSGSSAGGIIQFGRGPAGVPYELYYSATISALITDGKAQMLARPNVTTIQGREAIINIGAEVPVARTSTADSVTSTGFDYREAGIILRYTPRINENGDITADVHTEVSTPVYVADLKAYRFQKRSADTTVRLRNGETMVIGGLIDSDESKSYNKIPFLGDIPVIGNFFRSVKNRKQESELMIFLTARVLED